MKKEKLGYKQGGISILTNLLLFLLKFWAGISSGSVALIADAWHTLSDSVSSIIVIVGIRLSVRKPDKKHPFGYGRWEQLAAILIAILLAGTGLEIIRESIAKMGENQNAKYGALAIIITIISILTKEILAQYAFYCYRKTGYKSLRADGWHHRSDALSSVLILAGIFLSPYIIWIDSFLGILISLFLLYAAFEIIRDTIKKLLGEEAPTEIVDKIKTYVSCLVGNGTNPHHFLLHNYGKHQELSFHIKFPEDTSVKAGHSMATDIESKIFSEMGIISTVHMEPTDCKHYEIQKKT